MTSPEVALPEVAQDPNAAALEQARKKIKSAWIAACISGTVTLAVTLLAISGTSILNFSAWELIDVALIFGLAFGIYRKSRTCAVLMLVYFVAAKILLMVEAGKPNGLLLAIVFTYYFWQGVSGTFSFHRLKKAMSSLQAAASN
jgi:hypothetical protein